MRFVSVLTHYWREVLTATLPREMVSPRFGVCPFNTIAGDSMIDTKEVSESTLTDEQPTYSVSTWDHESEKWEKRESRASKWELRHWLRKLYAESWDHVSILVERNG
jgi:hypothetical protein